MPTKRGSIGETAGRAWRGAWSAALLFAGLASADELPGKSATSDEPPRIAVAVEPRQALLSDELTLAVTVDVPDGMVVDPIELPATLGAFEVEPSPESTLPQASAGRRIVRQTYKLQPTEVGSRELPAIHAVVWDRRVEGKETKIELTSKPTTVTIASSIDVKDPKLADLKGATEPMALQPPISWRYWATVAGLVAVAGLLLHGWLKGRGWRQAPTPMSARERALAELERLLKQGVMDADVKRFYAELTAIVRRFIEESVGVHAPEQTTEEFLREIGSHVAFSAAMREGLREFLESADLVKFAAWQPRRPDVEESGRRAQAFIELEPATPVEEAVA